MTPEQMEMFQLRSTQAPTSHIPGQVVQVGMPGDQEPEVDIVSQGLAHTVAYMAPNGPTRPIQLGRAKMMTKSQLEEQKMNESAGLPSNLDEASRVVALEQKVQNVDSKLDQILAAINPPRMSEMFDPATGMPVAPPLTPPVRPAVEQPQQFVPPPSHTMESPPPRTYPPPDPPTEPTILVQNRPGLPPVIYPQPSPQPASLETVPPVSPVSLGPVGSQAPDPTMAVVVGAGTSAGEAEAEAFFPGEAEPLVEMPISPGENQSDFDALIEEDEPAVDPVEQKRLERQQILTDQTMNWLSQKDPAKFWRQFVGGSCNRNLSYNTWPKEFQVAFDERFTKLVQDSQFVSVLCGRVIRFQNGHLVAPNIMGAFIVATAGFLSFALIDV